MNRVAIIGGGPGGLLSAYLIRRKYGGDVSCTIYEAANRLGGKLRTGTFERAPVPYESGAAEVYDYSMVDADSFQHLLGELGLGTRALQGQAVVLDGHVIRDESDIARYYGNATLQAVRDFRQRAAELMPLEHWHPDDWRFDARHPWAGRNCAQLLDTVADSTARRLLTVEVHSDLAAEPHQTDGLTGLKNFVMSIPGYVACKTIDGGMSRLAQRLTERIEGTDIVLNAPVTRVEQTRHNRWRVVTMQEGESRSEDVDAVIVALPATQLGALTFPGEYLRKAMNEHLARFDRPGHYLRVSLLFRTPFWQDQVAGGWFMVDAFGGACVYDESARYDTQGFGVLGFLLAGNAALQHANTGKRALTRSVLAALPLTLRTRADAQLLEVKVHRWCGAVSARPGSPRDPCSNHEPDSDRLRGLLLVGDYLFDSTLNGVHQSAELATSLLGAHLSANASSVSIRRSMSDGIVGIPTDALTAPVLPPVHARNAGLL